MKDARIPSMSTVHPILSDLNSDQQQAVLANDGPVLILAGAGSGKTRAITHKIAWLVREQGLQPWEILAVTFTNKAAGEMRRRCEEMLGPEAEDLWMGTFHRIGVRILRRHGELLGVPNHFVIYDQDDQRAMVGRTIENLGFSKDHVDPKTLQGFINRAKQRALDADGVSRADGIDHQDTWIRVFRAYEKAMREAGALDFNDLLVLPLRIMKEHPIVASEYKARWRYILVDEFQDTNAVQYDLLKAVLNDESRICVVGDDDQSIYRWRGAEVKNILSFDKDFPNVTVVRLERNYRCSGHILDTANALISENKTRHPKSLWTEREPGRPVQVFVAQTDTAEADYIARQVEKLRSEIPVNEMAIIYRTHAQSRVLEDAFRNRHIPYQVVGGQRFYERAEVKDLLAYLKVLINPDDLVSFERIINTPSRGIGRGTVTAIHQKAVDTGVSFWRAAKSLAVDGTTAQRNRLTPFISLMDDLMVQSKEVSARHMAENVLMQSGYMERLQSQRSAEADARLENLHELLNAIEEFADSSEDDSLTGYLQQVSLLTDVDRSTLGDPYEERLVMMSAHTAKGLEFDVVFLTGLEYGLFPHFNALNEAGGVEEERRLAYVAMTRARDVLYLTRAENRRRYGTFQAALPSTFLEDLPHEALQLAEPRQRPQSLAPKWQHRSLHPMANDDPFIQDMPDYENISQETSAFAPSSVVFHATFGEGKVVDLSGKGAKSVASVRFANGMVKKIMTRFLTHA